MARTIFGSIDLKDNQLLNVLLQLLGTDPSAVEGKIYYNSSSKEIRFHDGTQWRSLGVTGAGNPPSGAAGGDLSGSYPDPQIAVGAIVDSDVNPNAAIQQSKIAGLSTDLSGKVPGTRQVLAGNGLTGGGPLSGDITLNAAAGTGITVASDTIGLDTTYTDSLYVNVGGDTMTNYLTLHAHPDLPMQAATKLYVDLLAQGMSIKAVVHAAATADVPVLSGLQTIDDVALVEGNRVLLANQANPIQNGIWLASTGAWVRALSASQNGDIREGTVVPVDAGTIHGNSLQVCIEISPSPWQPDVSTSEWTRMVSVADLTAGQGLRMTGTAIDVGQGVGLQVNADEVAVKPADATVSATASGVSVVSAPRWTTSRTISLTGNVTGTATIDGTGNVDIATTVAAGVGGKRFAGPLQSLTTQAVTHNLGTRDVIVQVYNDVTPYQDVDVEVERTDPNTVTIKANPALPAGFRVVILG